MDRSLGRRVAEELAGLGWRVHRAATHFPDDAQDVEDEVWLAYGLERGWSLLCKDGRPRARPSLDGVLFYLDSHRLVVAEMVARFHQSQGAIHRAVEHGGPRAYAVGAVGIRATSP